MSGRNYQALVDYLMVGDWPICEATVEGVTIKPNGIKVSLVIEGDPSSLHALADLGETGGGVLLVLDSHASMEQAQTDLFQAKIDAVPADGIPVVDSQDPPPPDPPVAFNPDLDLPPDDDLSSYQNPIAEEEDEGFFNEKLDKPPLE